MTYSWLVITGAVVLVLIAGALIAWFRIARADRAGRPGGHTRRGRHRAEPPGGRRPAWFGAPRADRTDGSDAADAAREIGSNGPRLLVAATPAVALVVAVLPFTSGARADLTWLAVSLAFVAGSAVVLVLLNHAYARPFGLSVRPDRPRPRHGRRRAGACRRVSRSEPRPSRPRPWPPDAARRPGPRW